MTDEQRVTIECYEEAMEELNYDLPNANARTLQAARFQDLIQFLIR